LAGGWWLVLVCSERRVLLAGCGWLLVAGSFWEKSTAGWWRERSSYLKRLGWISWLTKQEEAARCPEGRGFFTTRLSLALWSDVWAVLETHTPTRVSTEQQLPPCPFEASAESTWARPAFLSRPWADTWHRSQYVNMCINVTFIKV
jgi:hypothetical protein